MSGSNELRPTCFDTYVGQKSAMDTIKVMVKAASMRGCSVGHMLFSGPPGLGKTTVAGVIANEIGSDLHFITAPSLNSRAKLIESLFKLNDNDVFFIDEIHSMNLKVEEILYKAAEDFKVEAVVGVDRDKETMAIPLPKFTLIGATTKVGKVSSPLRTRFQKIIRMEYYSVEELARIAYMSAETLGVEILHEACQEIGRRSRGTPRTTNQILATIRDYSLVEGLEPVTYEDVCRIMDGAGIDSAGLREDDRMYLKALQENSTTRAVGLNTLASLIGQEPQTIEDSIEPFLMRQGLIQRTPGGRVITDAGLRHLQGDKVW